MRIRNAYIVYVDFDGDIHSEVEGHYVFAGEDAYNEAKEIVRQALKDLYNHLIKKGWSTDCDIDGYSVTLKDIINIDEILDAYIECGDGNFGNWTIEIERYP